MKKRGHAFSYQKRAEIARTIEPISGEFIISLQRRREYAIDRVRNGLYWLRSSADRIEAKLAAYDDAIAEAGTPLAVTSTVSASDGPGSAGIDFTQGIAELAEVERLMSEFVTAIEFARKQTAAKEGGDA